MNLRTSSLRPRLAAALVAVTAAIPATGQAELPISGRPVSQFLFIDNWIRGFMEEQTRDITAGVVGISRGGKVIYLRGFGYLHSGAALPEHALFRQASVVKPITAAAIHRFDAAGGFGTNAATERLLRRAFDVAGNNGLLNVMLPPGLGLGDPLMTQITVGHLLNHSAGWDRNPQPITDAWGNDFPITRVRGAGIQMNQPDALPSRPQMIGYALQFPLNYAPGAATYTQPVPTGSPPGTMPVTLVPGPAGTYSNLGYLVLGEILEAHAPGGYLGYVAGEIMSTAHWIPASEWGLARSLESQLSPREPAYVNAGTGPSVFDYTAPVDSLPYQYGAWHVETMMAHGGLIASSQAMLQFGRLFSVGYLTRGTGATQSNDIGLLVPATGFPDGSDAFHTGSLPGCSSILRQLGRGPGPDDDLVIHIVFNRRHGTSEWAQETSNQIIAWLDFIDGLGTWPTAVCDGFWVLPGVENPAAGDGGYLSEIQGLGSAVGRLGDGSRLRLKPGTSHWTGNITKRLEFSAPDGTVVIGAPD